MSTSLDASISLKKETTYGTPVTPDVAYEFTEESFDYVPTFTDGVGFRARSRVRASRSRVLTKEETSGAFTVEATSKGLGKLFEAALGTGTSTLISGTSYQQLFTPIADDYLPSYTIQKSVPLIGGSVSPQTYAGMVCSGFELSAPLEGIPTIQFSFMGKSMTTATAFAALNYPASPVLFSFVNGAITVGGAPTVPSTTALAAGGTTVANIREITVSYDNALDGGGFTLGGAGQRGRKPVVGRRVVSGSLTAEYTNDVLRDAWKAQTDLAIVLTFQTATAISGANFPTLQVTIPVVRLDGEMPKATVDGSPATQSISFTGLDGEVAAHPIYVAIVTAETAI